MRNIKSITNTTGGLVVLVVAVICLNIIATKLYFRADVTADKVYSLSDGTKRILGKLDHEVTARLYFSRSLKELPPVVKAYATRVEEVLNEYRSRSGGKLTVEVVDPKPDTDDEEWAQKYGINGVRLPKGDSMYFGVVLLSGSKEIAIPYLDPRREEFLEYDLSEALVSTMKKDQAKIGVMSPLPVMGSSTPGGQPEEPWVLAEDLKRNFDVQAVPPATKEIPKDLKALIIIHPKNFTDETLYAIDQYLMNGGRLIVAVDPMSRVDLATSGAQARMMGQMPQVASSLEKLFAAWDLEYDPANIVGDAGLATQINAGGQVVAYPFFITLGAEQLSKTSVITGNLRQLMYAEGGAFSQKKDSKYAFEPLIKTTKDTGTASAQLAGFMMPADLAREMKVEEKERVLAALVRGKFKSAFEAGKAPATDKHKSECDQETMVVVVGDTDFLSDQNAVDKFRFGSQTMVRVRNDNLNFLFNAADVLGGSEDLIAIRSRGRIARPFTKVAELQKGAQVKWQAEEEKLTAELTDLQKKLNDLQSQRTDNNRFTLSSQQQDEIAKFRDEERKIRSRRREVRKNLREDIEALGRRLIAANLLVVPLATSAFGLGVFVKRSRRNRKERAHGQ